jgi:predicted phage terminase large subunit-like protein
LNDSATCSIAPPPQTKEDWIPTEEELDQVLAYQSLIEFIALFWDKVETEPLQINWHHHDIADHLEAVTNGDLHRLLVNIPPKGSKSTITNVFWPAWVWLRDPSHRFFHTSYSDDLVVRDAEKFKQILDSPEYQELMDIFQPGFDLVKDATKNLVNNKGGRRKCSTVRGMSTGDGGDTIVVDDPHDVQKALSDTDRKFVTEVWWDLTMSTRLHSAKGNFVVIMQRLHGEDLSGHILKKDTKKRWVHLCIPARYEVKERTRTTLDFEDPRTEEGDLLWPDRFPEDIQKEIEDSLGQWGAAGQMQQRPTPRGGGMVKVDKLVYFTQNPDDTMEHGDLFFNPGLVMEAVRYWDKAYTQGGGCRTAGVKLYKMREDCPVDWMVVDCVAGQWGVASREARIRQTAESDRANYRSMKGSRDVDVRIWIEEEGGAGKESAEATVRNLTGFSVHKEKVSKSKELRMEPFAAQVGIGKVGILRGPWNQLYVDELRIFPNSDFKDQADATSGAFNAMNVKKKVAGVWGTPRSEMGTRKKKRVYKLKNHWVGR